MAPERASDPFMRISASVRVAVAIFILSTEVVSPLVSFALFGGDSFLWLPKLALDLVFHAMVLAPMFLWPKAVGLFHPLALPVFYGLARVVTKDPTSILAPFGFFSGEPLTMMAHPALPGFDTAQLLQGRILLTMLEIFGMVCYFAGYAVIAPRVRAGRLPPMPAQVGLKSLAIVGAVFVGAFVFIGAQGGFIQHLSVLAFGRHEAMKDFGIFVVVFNLAPMAIYIWAASRPEQIGTPYFIVGLIAAATIPFLITGSRSASIITIVTVVVIWVYHNRRIPVVLIALLAPVTFLILGYLQAVRSSAWSTGQVDFGAGAMSIADLFEETQRQMMARTAVEGGIPVVVRGPETTGLLMGETYLSAVLFWIPRPLWEDKPRGVGAYYVNEILSPGSKSSVPVGPIAEAYWNFHIPGIFVVMFLWGGFHSWLTMAFRASKGPFFLVFYILTVTLAQPCTDNVVDYLQLIALLPLLRFFYVSVGARTQPFARPS